jgi:hypothetical protein
MLNNPQLRLQIQELRRRSKELLALSQKVQAEWDKQSRLSYELRARSESYYQPAPAQEPAASTLGQHTMTTDLATYQPADLAAPLDQSDWAAFF